MLVTILWNHLTFVHFVKVIKKYIVHQNANKAKEKSEGNKITIITNNSASSIIFHSLHRNMLQWPSGYIALPVCRLTGCMSNRAGKRNWFKVFIYININLEFYLEPWILYIYIISKAKKRIPEVKNNAKTSNKVWNNGFPKLREKIK